MIHVKAFEFNPFQENTYIVYDESKEAIIIDPGCYDPSEKDHLANFIESNKLEVTKLINTHCHIDHVLGNQWVKDKYQVELFIHSFEKQILESVKTYAGPYGFPGYQPAEPDHLLDESETLEFGKSSFSIEFVPGHSPGHLAFINESEKICVGGDVLFKDSIGRTDLPGGDHDTLINSIQTKLFALADDCIVYPGHGTPTTIGYEKISNPFCGIEQSSS